MDVRSLNALAETWRSTADATGRFVPGFDPCSGGTASRVLVLMQSPGPRTIAAGSAAVCSEDNLGPTAAAFRAARIESGLSRDHYLRWHLIPWEIPGRVRPADIEEGRLALGELLELLPALGADEDLEPLAFPLNHVDRPFELLVFGNVRLGISFPAHVALLHFA